MLKAQSIYIHIPFCKSKCPYCDFASWANKGHLVEQYFDALISEIQTKCEAYRSWRTGVPESRRTGEFPHLSIFPSPVRSIFLGGGTPSLLSPEYYEKLFGVLKTYFNIDDDCEITLELNPGTARDDYLKGYKELGINRISIGAQSFNEKVLEKLGRKHSVMDTIEAINKVKSAGFENFSLDLIYAVPGMTKDIWSDTLNQTLELKPNHISAYTLIIEPETPFEKIYKDPKSLPNDDFTFELYIEACNLFRKNGYLHYEISNFAKPSYECKHNLTYWQNKEYFAFGVGSHRYLNGLRTCNVKSLEEYILAPNVEYITNFPLDYNFEKIMLSSRLKNGFDLGSLQKISSKKHQEMRSLLLELSKNGLLELFNRKIHLTDKGLFVNNEILLRLL